MLFFTHRNFKRLFIEPEDGVSKEWDVNAVGWEALYFFMFLVAVEHLVIAARLIIKNTGEIRPAFIKQGEYERRMLIKKF